MQSLCRVVLIANDKQTENVVEHIGSNLLLGIAPRIVRTTVALDDKTIKTEIHSLLTQWCYQVATSTDVAWVADDRQLRNAAMQFDRNLPHRQVAIDLLVEA